MAFSASIAPPPKGPGTWLVALVAVAALASSAAAAKAYWPASTSGEVTASRPMSLPLGTDGSALLDTGTRVSWKGAKVKQEDGRATYLTAPGKRLTVQTPGGDVELAPGTHAMVKVRRDRAGQPQVLVEVSEGHADAAGLALGDRASAVLGREGPKVAQGERAFDEREEERDREEAGDDANERLVDQVRDYKKRLERTSAEHAELASKLKTAEQKLAEHEGRDRRRSDYDLTTEDWAELADRGVVKYRMPCSLPDTWRYPTEELTRMGLSAADRQPLADAHRRSVERTWAAIRPLCAEVLHATPEVIESIGMHSCVAIIRMKDMDGKPLADINGPYAQVAAMRAGRVPLPADGEKPSAVVRALLVLTEANALFERDLARTFGPDEAHRIAFDEGACASTGTFEDGAGLRKP